MQQYLDKTITVLSGIATKVRDLNIVVNSIPQFNQYEILMNRMDQISGLITGNVVINGLVQLDYYGDGVYTVYGVVDAGKLKIDSDCQNMVILE